MGWFRKEVEVEPARVERSRIKDAWTPNDNGITSFQGSIYYTKLERYAKFLELYVHFYDFIMHKRMCKTKVTKLQKNCDAISAENRNESMNVLSACVYGCGSAPCSCPVMWRLFEDLRKEFKMPWILDTICKQMDQNSLYSNVQN